MSDDLMTIEEVAQRMRMSVKFLRRETANGELRTVRLGRSVRVRPEDLKEYVAGRITRPTDSDGGSDA